MELIYYRGLDCYLACAVSAAADIGLDYTRTFAALWAEMDFSFANNVFTTKRLFSELEKIGAKFENNCSAEVFFNNHCGESVYIIGMDAFDVPWSPVFQLFHELHYFIVFIEETNESELVTCCDPTYGLKNVFFNKSELIQKASDICRFIKTPVRSFEYRAADAAREASINLPGLPGILLNGLDRSNAAIRGKLADALMNNRYLFNHYFPVFVDSHLKRWEAVKYGLIKLSLANDGGKIKNEVSEMADTLVNDELTIARRILNVEQFG